MEMSNGRAGAPKTCRRPLQQSLARVGLLPDGVPRLQ